MNLHWTNHWDEISARIARQPDLLLATDFDGTLAPIAPTPAQAVLAAETRTLLRRLMACPGTNLAVISGRSLADVRMHVNIEGLYYVGNHGLELSGPGIELRSCPASKAQGELRRVIALLVEETADLDGVFIEEKGVSASVHWRLASHETRERLHAVVHAAVAQYPRLRLDSGQCVWELRPREGWNKGDALTHLMARLRRQAGAVVYIGDDITDEDAFRAVEGGLTFRVGEKNALTVARYQIRDAADVQAFLLCVLGVRSKIGRALNAPRAESVVSRHFEYNGPNCLMGRHF